MLTLINLQVLENNSRFYVFELLHNYIAAAAKRNKNVIACAFLWKNHKPKFPFNVYYSSLSFEGIRKSSWKFVLSDFFFFAKLYLNHNKNPGNIP